MSLIQEYLIFIIVWLSQTPEDMDDLHMLKTNTKA